MAQVQSKVIDISDQEILAAFSRVVKNKDSAVYEKHCLFFFIDGLDEFQETTQMDHKEVVELLCDWAGRAAGGIKMCVSSREDNVYMSAFSAEKRLRLHELTYFDMEAFASAKLNHIANPGLRKKLVGHVVQKAQGIFLWVVLVIQGLRNEIENGVDDVQWLVKSLDALPGDLDELYKHVFKSLAPPIRRRAYRTLAMVVVATERKLGITPAGYSFYPDYELDPKRILQKSFLKSTISNFSQTQRSALGHKFLRGWCGGFLETTKTRIGHYDAGEII